MVGIWTSIKITAKVSAMTTRSAARPESASTTSTPNEASIEWSATR
jgi:hypothetical protein